MRRLIGVVVVALLLALGGALWWLTYSLDAFVERRIEQVGTATLGTDVSIGSVDVDLRGGQATIRKLRVANPEGFSSERALSLDEIVVRIDVATVRSSPLVLTEVSATAPAIRAEANAEGALNLDVLRRNAASAPAAPTEQPTRLRVRKLVVAEGRLEGDASSLGGRELEATFPGVRLANLEGTPAELGRTVATAVLRQAVATAARAGVRTAIEKQIDRLGESAAEAAKGLLRGLTDEKEP